MRSAVSIDVGEDAPRIFAVPLLREQAAQARRGSKLQRAMTATTSRLDCESILRNLRQRGEAPVRHAGSGVSVSQETEAERVGPIATRAYALPDSLSTRRRGHVRGADKSVDRSVDEDDVVDTQREGEGRDLVIAERS